MAEPEEIPGGLARLEERLREDLERLCYPPLNWVAPSHHDQGPVTDVVIIGGGMCGLVAAFCLRRLGIQNLRILDRAEAGLEGPWVTYARMDTLRSPKQLVGPAAGMASLTFRAWHEARFGEAAWDALDKIPRPMWMDYLRWYRAALDLPVENGVEVLAIEPLEGGLFRLALRGAAEPVAIARKVVLATGRDGLGAAAVPAFVRGLPRHRWAHSSDPIDFEAYRGRRVVVIGAGASSVENAAEACEHGAAEVRLLIRRPDMPRINKLMGIGSPGFTHGYPELSDLWRWRIMHYAGEQQTPAPHGSTRRASAAGARFHFGCAIETMAETGSGVRITCRNGRVFETDVVILGTGFSVDVFARPELRGFAGRIATWADRFTPPPGLEDPELIGFPYLRPGFAFTEREPGTAPWLRDLHCFNYAATLSLGKVSGDIPAVSEGAESLARTIAADFYTADIETMWQQLQDYARPELQGDEWVDADQVLAKSQPADGQPADSQPGAGNPGTASNPARSSRRRASSAAGS